MRKKESDVKKQELLEGEVFSSLGTCFAGREGGVSVDWVWPVDDRGEARERPAGA